MKMLLKGIFNFVCQNQLFCQEVVNGCRGFLSCYKDGLCGVRHHISMVYTASKKKDSQSVLAYSIAVPAPVLICNDSCVEINTTEMYQMKSNFCF